MDKHNKLHSVQNDAKAAPEKNYSADDYKQLVEQNNQLMNKVKLLEDEIAELKIMNLESHKWSSQLKSLRKELQHVRKNNSTNQDSRTSQQHQYNLKNGNSSRLAKHFRKFRSGPFHYCSYMLRKIKMRITHE